MKKLILAAVAIFIIGGVVVITRQQAQAPSSSTAVEQGEIPQEKTDQPTETNNMSGKYVDYKVDTIAKTTGTKLLFFHAPWCPQCRELEADIKSKGAPTGVTIIKVDYDTNQNLRKQYGVTIQTTIVRVDDAGKLVKKYVAYDSPTVDAVRQNLLN